jgi:hypothetical protein
MTLVLEPRVSLALKRVRVNSRTPAVIQLRHPFSDSLMSITATPTADHKPWLICLYLQNPAGHWICVSGTMFLVVTLLVSRQFEGPRGIYLSTYLGIALEILLQNTCPLLEVSRSACPVTFLECYQSH